MKKFLAIILMMWPLCAGAQKVVKDEYDPYNKVHVKETSYERISSGAYNALRAKVRSTDGKVVVWFKITLHDMFSITEGSEVVVLLEDGNTVHFRSLKSGVSNIATGSPSFYYEDFPYEVKADEVNLLKNSPTKSARIQLLDNRFVDFSISSRRKWYIRDAIKLLQ